MSCERSLGQYRTSSLRGIEDVHTIDSLWEKMKSVGHGGLWSWVWKRIWESQFLFVHFSFGHFDAMLEFMFFRKLNIHIKDGTNGEKYKYVCVIICLNSIILIVAS